MDELEAVFGEKSRLKALLEHFSQIDDPRPSHKVAYPLAEVLLLAVCGTIADCDSYEAIGLWGERHIAILRQFLPYYHGVPTGRWLTLLMNRINPALFSACFTDWVRACWPDRPELVAIDGKTSRRSHDRGSDQPALHLVSAFASTSRLVLGQGAVADKTNELTAIPLLLERLAKADGLKGTIITIDAIACNGTIAKAVRDAGADYLLAVKANQPTLRKEIEEVFAHAPKASLERTDTDVDKGHGRIEQRTVTLVREADWLNGERRFPGELRLPDVAAIIKVESKAELKDRCRFETRYYITSAHFDADAAARAIRGHWGIKTSSIGCSMSVSTRINLASERAMAPKIWPSSATSPLIMFASRPNQSGQSAPACVARPTSHPRQNQPASDSGENAPDGTSLIYKLSLMPKFVNLDSVP